MYYPITKTTLSCHENYQIRILKLTNVYRVRVETNSELMSRSVDSLVGTVGNLTSLLCA